MLELELTCVLCLFGFVVSRVLGFECRWWQGGKVALLRAGASTFALWFFLIFENRPSAALRPFEVWSVSGSYPGFSAGGPEFESSEEGFGALGGGGAGCSKHFS